MYKDFFGFKEPPFNITPDSKFFFLSQHHREALGNLSYGIATRKGFIVISGEIGSGKTTLCRAIIPRLNSPKTKIALIFNPIPTELQLLRAINQEFGLETRYNTKKKLVDELNRFLLAENSKDHNVVIMIDEAQNLTPEILEELRLLSNLETEKDKLLQIVLIGQPELNMMLTLPQLAQLNQRIAVRYHLYPLNKPEIEKYIYHRLNTARPEKQITFTKGAIRRIYQHSSGVPRKINIVCDRALLAAYVAETTKINKALVDKAIEELEPPCLIPSSREIKPTILQDRPSTLPLLVYTVIGLSCILLIVLFFMLISPGAWQEQLFGSAQEKTEIKQAEVAVGQYSVASRPTPALTKSAETSSKSPMTQKQLQPTASSAPTINELRPLWAINSIRSKSVTAAADSPSSYNWDYDAQGFIRISDPALSYQASIINWLKLWNITVDTKEFKNYRPETIGTIDLFAENPALGLKKFSTQLSLHELTRLNTPFILHIEARDKGLSPFVVLFHLSGDSAKIIDPVNGVFALPLSYLNSKLVESMCLYFDRQGICSITKGENSPRVEALQSILYIKGFYKGEISGTYDDNTERAIAYLQRSFNLRPTGELTPSTALLISLFQNAHCPTLTERGKQVL